MWFECQIWVFSGRSKQQEKSRPKAALGGSGIGQERH